MPSPVPALSKSAPLPQPAPLPALQAEVQAALQVPAQSTTPGDGKVGRGKAAKGNAPKAGRGDPFGKPSSKSNGLFGADESFLDVKNVQPAPMRQKPAPATQQPIPLLKSAPNPKAGEEQQPLVPTTGVKTRKMSKGGKVFPSKTFDPSLK